MDDSYTHISFVLDRSGSMEDIADDIIGGVNRFLDDQKLLPGKMTVSIAQFDDEYEVLYQMVDIKQIPHLNRQTFIPRGNTALRDAVGRTINALGHDLSLLPEPARPSKVIFVIVSDGMENASREFSEQQVEYMKTHQEERYGWQFSYMGCKQDAVKEAQKSLGIQGASALTYAASALGISLAFDSLGERTKSYRGNQARSMAWTEEDRRRQCNK